MMVNTICYDCRKVYAYKLKGKCPGCKSGNTKHFVELDDVTKGVMLLLKDIYDNGFGCPCSKCIKRRMDNLFIPN